METNYFHKAILDEWAAKGLIIRGGFIVFREALIPQSSSIQQVEAMEFAYMAGAQHLFASIMTVLDADSEPTEKDLEVMTKIHSELKLWEQEAKLRVSKPGGHG